MTICRSDSPYARARELLPVKEAAVRYGFEPDRAGFISCPFHGGDDTPSLKLYDGPRGWHCFGCGEGGDVVKFVAMLFKINARAALLRIDCDFSLGLLNEPEQKRQALPPAREDPTAEFRKEYDAKVAEARACRIELRSCSDGGRMGALMGRLEYLDWWFEVNPWR